MRSRAHDTERPTRTELRPRRRRAMSSTCGRGRFEPGGPLQEGFDVKIARVEVIPFATSARISFGELVTDHPLVQTVTKVVTDEGPEGYYFGGHFHGDQDSLVAGDRMLMTQFLGPLLAGRDAFDREQIWQQLWAAKLPENVCSVINLARGTLPDSVTGLPVHKLLGGGAGPGQGLREQLQQPRPARGLRRPRGGVPASGLPRYKIHPYFAWDPATRQPTVPKPPPVDWDIEICRAVRDRGRRRHGADVRSMGRLLQLRRRARSVASSSVSASPGTSTPCPSTASSPT